MLIITNFFNKYFIFTNPLGQTYKAKHIQNVSLQNNFIFVYLVVNKKQYRRYKGIYTV